MQAISYHHSFYYHYIPIWLLTRYITNTHTHTHTHTNWPLIISTPTHTHTHTHTLIEYVSVGARRRAGLIGVWTEKADCSCLLHAHTHAHTHTLAQHNPSRYLIHNTLSAWLSSFNLLFPPSFFSHPSISNQAFSEDQRAWAWKKHLCLHKKSIKTHYSEALWLRMMLHSCVRLFSYSLGTHLFTWSELNMTNFPLLGCHNVSYITFFGFNSNGNGIYLNCSIYNYLYIKIISTCTNSAK